LKNWKVIFISLTVLFIRLSCLSSFPSITNPPEMDEDFSFSATMNASSIAKFNAQSQLTGHIDSSYYPGLPDLDALSNSIFFE
jgi:hypothetical protein